MAPIKTTITEDKKNTRKAWYIRKDKQDQTALALAEEDKGYLIKLSTTDEQYAITTAAISVNASITDNGLNLLLRSMLNEAGYVKTIPYFDFILNGEILPANTSIGELLDTEYVSSEKVLSITYFVCQPVPKPHDNLEHDDWVSAVHCQKEWLVTGCYDNTVQLWSVKLDKVGQGKSAHKITVNAHKAPVKAVKWFGEDSNTFVSGSMDQKAYVWEWNPKTNTVEQKWECHGHSANISSIDTYQSRYFITSSWDKTLKLWDIDRESSGEKYIASSRQQPAKKSKHENAKTPEMTLMGHTKGITAVCWMKHPQVISCSSDHSLIIWDIKEGKRIKTCTSNMGFLSLAYCEDKNIVLAGCTDRHIRLYDQRQYKLFTNVATDKFAVRKKWVSSLCMSNYFDNYFVSGCHDGTTDVWDIRSQKAPIHTLMGHKDKILAVDWSHPDFIVSGSADSTAKMFSIEPEK